MRLRDKNGFTLIEIMLVVIIVGILAGIVAQNLAGRGEQARIAAARAAVDANLAGALDLYEVDNGRYPTTEQGLKALVFKPTAPPEPLSWNGPYLKKKAVPKDPWGNEFVYVSPGSANKESYDLSSYGPDAVESEDDIVNWEKEESVGE